MMGRKGGTPFTRTLKLVIYAAIILIATKGLFYLKDNYNISFNLPKFGNGKKVAWNYQGRWEKDDDIWYQKEYPQPKGQSFLSKLADSVSIQKTDNAAQQTNDTPSQTKASGKKSNVSYPSYYSNLEMARNGNMDFDKFFVKSGFVVYYNTEHKNPEFVCYSTTKAELKANTQRSDDFHNEDDYTNKYMGAVATLDDYRKSGWQRGHQISSASLLFDEKSNYDSFSMVNISPQSAKFNSKLNLKAENAERDAARQFEEIYCCTGPLLHGIDLKSRKTIGSGVTVPDYFFKAWLVFDKNGKAHTLAVLMPQEYTDGNLTPYFMTVNELEERTGLDFFFNLDDSIEEQTEGRYDLSLWPVSFK